MRSSKAIFAACAAAVFAVSSIAVAGAFVASSSGSVIRLASPPASVKDNALIHATSVYAFDEAQRKTLTSAVAVDAVDPGTYSTFPAGVATIAAGTQVDSHMIHSDVKNPFTARRQGSVTFSDDILGVIASTSKLAASDTLGAPGTAYAGSTVALRGLESSESTAIGADAFTISANRRTITFDIQTYVMDQIRVVTRHKNPLVTTIADAPDPVTAGNDVQYIVTVTNTKPSTVTGVKVRDEFPDATFVSASAIGGCTGGVIGGTGPVTCTLGSIPAGGSRSATIVVKSPSTVPEGDTIVNTATSPPNIGPFVDQITTVEAPEEGVAKGFVSPGDDITIEGDNPATVTLPETGTGAPIVITQGEGTFCNGPCSGPFTEISDFPGYDDPNNPIHLTLTFNFPDDAPGDSLEDAADAFNSTIYKNDTPLDPDDFDVVADCATPGAGDAIPSPCVDDKSLVQTTLNNFVVTFEIVYLSGDPKFGRR